MSVFVIYEKPIDYPDSFVLREQMVDREGHVYVASECRTAPDLESIRAELPAGLYNLGRHPNDDPQIREVWV